MSRLFAGLVVAVLLLGGCSESEEPEGTPNIGDLRAALEDGASCAELIGISNEMDPKSADYEAAPEVLRSVGCYSSGSERTD